MRKDYLNTAHRHYQRKFSKSCHCVYCGAAAESIDHVYPVSEAARLSRDVDLSRPSVRRELGQGLNLVPACSECNSIAGSEPFTSIRAKRAFIQKRLRERHKDDLVGPVWSLDEINDLGPTLRQHVLLGLRRRCRLADRISYPRRGCSVAPEVLTAELSV